MKISENLQLQLISATVKGCFLLQNVPENAAALIFLANIS